MTPDHLFVTALGLGLIGFIIWFFWLKRTKGMRAAETSGGYQEAMILVKGGYTPDTIIVRHGRPVRLSSPRGDGGLLRQGDVRRLPQERRPTDRPNCPCRVSSERAG